MIIIRSIERAIDRLTDAASKAGDSLDAATILGETIYKFIRLFF